MQLFFQKITLILLCSALKFQLKMQRSVQLWTFQCTSVTHHSPVELQDTQSLWNHWYHQYVGTSTKPIIQTTNMGRLTLVAFFMNLALSFSMSCQDLIGVFSSSPTTIPGPWVAGPPMKAMMRAPVLGKVHYKREGNWGKQLISTKLWTHFNELMHSMISKTFWAKRLRLQFKCLKLVRLHAKF